jgi:hypothetical protein
MEHDLMGCKANGCAFSWCSIDVPVACRCNKSNN